MNRENTTRKIQFEKTKFGEYKPEAYNSENTHRNIQGRKKNTSNQKIQAGENKKIETR